MYTSTELYHHGVKGQKWGVRRYQNSDGSLTAAGRRRYAKELGQLKAEKKRLRNMESTAKKLKKLDDMRDEIDAKKRELSSDPHTNLSSKRSTSTTHTKTLSEMSNDEIQAKIDRIGLERRYSELTSEPAAKTQVSHGKKFMMDVLESSGKNVANQTLTYVMGKGVNKVIESLGGEANAINPKKGQKDK